jgi:hypothetical protein
MANAIRVGEHIAERLGASGTAAWAPALRTAEAAHPESAVGRDA